MSVLAKPQFTVEEFQASSAARDGRWELQDGEPVAMSPERLAHAETKYEAVVSLRAGIERAKGPCHAVPDGVTVRISARRF
jgi:Uma2 family endonuclease